MVATFEITDTPPTPDNNAFSPFGAHKEVIRARDMLVLVEGPAGTGKTITILNKILACCEKYPGARWLIIRATRFSLNETVLATFEEKVLPKDSPLLEGPERANRKTYEFANGSRIVLGGLDNPMRYYSGEYDGVYIPEAVEVTRDQVFSFVRALRNHVMPYQQIIMDCNPDYELHWLNLACEAGEVRRIRTTHADNPFITEEYLANLDKLTGILRARLRDGLWVSAEGTVYSLLAKHLGDDLFNEDKPTQLAVDPGNGSGPYAALVIQQIGPRVLVVAEFYKVGGIDEDLRDWLIASPYYAKLVSVVSDPAKQDTIKRLQAMLGVPVQAKEGRKDITAQISAVRSLMEDEPPRGVGLLIDRKRTPMLQEEFQRYRWKKQRGDRNVPEEPEDANNHCLDALAYWVTTRALLGVRTLGVKLPKPKRYVSVYEQ